MSLFNTSNLERVAGIEPASSAWKAEVLPLNYTRYSLSSIVGPVAGGASSGGGGWIRTTEAFASDLQSDPFGHSGTPAKGEIKFAAPHLKKTSFPGRGRNGAGDRSRTYDLLITSQLLYQLSYASFTEAVHSKHFHIYACCFRL